MIRRIAVFNVQTGSRSASGAQRSVNKLISSNSMPRAVSLASTGRVLRTRNMRSRLDAATVSGRARQHDPTESPPIVPEKPPN